MPIAMPDASQRADFLSSKPLFLARNIIAVSGKPKNSFTGVYYQVLPDDRDSYHDIYGVGSFTMTGLDSSKAVPPR